MKGVGIGKEGMKEKFPVDTSLKNFLKLSLRAVWPVLKK